ncbi:hypothetical protein GCM10025867_48380 (plasmid) [Frondihabitans sucicola]|uniref:Exo-alpha-sialidase n=1 Tax=Frondihabitans sucicola TaxID=1268041 RepID=A0ABM8GVX1_9MICO|nr:hypothetical protein [Frondihabitans sucicola]BDZ52597.1 hypothetical protein GCM10025867_48380 [Frondihabitans sucicola]
MAIAALLILAAIPQFNQYRQKAVVSNLQNDVHNASLAAESALIGAVSKHSGGEGDSGIHLTAAAPTDEIALITAAVATVKLSTTTDQPLAVADVGSGGYAITASSTKTDIKAVYLSQLTATMPKLTQGINLIGKDGSVIGAPADSTPTATPTGTPTPTSTPSAPAVVIDDSLAPDGTAGANTAGSHSLAASSTSTNSLDFGTKGSTLLWTQSNVKRPSSPTFASDGTLAWGTTVAAASAYDKSGYSTLQQSEGGKVLVFRTNGGQMLYSIDGGTTIKTLPLPAGAVTSYALSGDGSIVYGIWNSTLYKVTNLAAATPTVTSAPTGVSGNYGSFNPATNVDGSKIVFFNGALIELSTDGGKTFNVSLNVTTMPAASVGKFTLTQVTMSRDGSTITALGHDGNYAGALFVSTDGGSSWRQTTGSGSSNLDHVAVSGNGHTMISGSENSGETITVSFDSGSTWQNVKGQVAGSAGGWAQTYDIAISGDGHTWIASQGGNTNRFVFGTL